ncbi:peptidoglycan recognition protein [Streptomyces sp. NPDC053431]|uniref:peptidoglycan recognition protein n=1 Tax=Streptomyces sp. NPDC053431 TaxID=3365703 RepID=UPI0037D5E9F1
MKSGRRARRRTATRIRRTAIGAALAGVTVLAFQAAANGAVFGTEGETPAPADVYSANGEENGPVKSEVHKLALADQGHGEAVLSQRDTARFGLLGVSWTDPQAKIKGKVQARTRSADTGEWTEWMDLVPYPALLDGKRAGARGSTEPIWVGASDGAEVRVSDGAADGKLPAGLRLDLVDPGASNTAEKSSGDLNAAPAAYVADAPPTPTGPASTAPRPTIVSRAEWGADESLNNEGPIYLPGGKIKAVFVHHTTDADYSCADSAAVVRAIHVYHVKTNGWRDLGYNFLVDKCGKIFEGRQGGVDQPVMGAHTYGWNSESTSVSFIGDYTSQTAPQAALISAARVVAYKLGQYGVDPGSTSVTLTAGGDPATETLSNYFGKKFTPGQQYTFSAVNGHRDGFNTQCPGNSLYPQLPQIRSYATGSVANLKIDSLTGGASKAGTGYETPGPLTVNWSTTTSPNSLIHKFEVLVDGQVVMSPWGHIRSAAVSVSGYGEHTVAVRATHVSGKVTTSAPVTVTVPGPKTFHPVDPKRLMNTMAGLGVPKAKVGPGQEVVLQVAGVQGIPATGVGAVVLNVTATNPTASSFVSVYPNGTNRPSTSNLNFTAGVSIPNLVVVPVVDGKVRFYNHAGSVDLLADITGYYTKDASGSTFATTGPARIMNTIAGQGVPTKLGPASTASLQVTGVAGIPSTGVTAVVMNVTATNPTNSGWVSVYPSGTTRPSTSNLNFRAGQSIPNLVIVPVGADGKVSFYNHAGSVDLLGDVTGYFTTDTTQAKHVNIGPKRLMNTIAGQGVRQGKVGAKETVTLQVTGANGIPASGVTAVVINVTATNPTSSGWVSVYPSDQTRPPVSNLNFTTGLSIPNLVVVPVSADGKVSFYNHAGSVDLLADITGYFVK